MLRVRSIVMPVLAILLAASGPAECDGSGSGSGKACGLEPHLVAHDSHVIASARAACDPPPHSHFFNLELEMLVDEPDVWKGPDGHTFEFQDSTSEYFSLDECRE